MYGSLAYHYSLEQTAEWVSNAAGAQFAYILLTDIFSIGALYLFVRRHRSNFRVIGLRRPRWSDAVYGLAAVLPYLLVFGLMVAVVKALVPDFNTGQQQDIGFHGVQGGAQLLLAFVSLVVLPPIAEEIMVRGFIYGSLKKALPVFYAVVFTSLLFAFAHLPEGGASGPLYIAALDTFVLSLILIYLREKTGGLWASMLLHAVKNSIAFMYLFAQHFR